MEFNGDALLMRETVRVNADYFKKQKSLFGNFIEY